MCWKYHFNCTILLKLVSAIQIYVVDYHCKSEVSNGGFFWLGFDLLINDTEVNIHSEWSYCNETLHGRKTRLQPNCMVFSQAALELGCSLESNWWLNSMMSSLVHSMSTIKAVILEVGIDCIGHSSRLIRLLSLQVIIRPYKLQASTICMASRIVLI